MLLQCLLPHFAPYIHNVFITMWLLLHTVAYHHIVCHAILPLYIFVLLPSITSTTSHDRVLAMYLIAMFWGSIWCWVEVRECKGNFGQPQYWMLALYLSWKCFLNDPSTLLLMIFRLGTSYLQAFGKGTRAKSCCSSKRFFNVLAIYILYMFTMLWYWNLIFPYTCSVLMYVDCTNLYDLVLLKLWHYLMSLYFTGMYVAYLWHYSL